MLDFYLYDQMLRVVALWCVCGGVGGCVGVWVCGCVGVWVCVCV